MIVGVLLAPSLAWAGSTPGPVTPVPNEATDNIFQETEIPPQPWARIDGTCDDFQSYDNRSFSAVATLNTKSVDRWATFRIIVRAKEVGSNVSVTLYKWNRELGPGEKRKTNVFSLYGAPLYNAGGVSYDRVKFLVKLAQPGPNPTLTSWRWNRTTKLYHTRQCNLVRVRGPEG